MHAVFITFHSGVPLDDVHDEFLAGGPKRSQTYRVC
jgi:hypothetical protein